MPGTTRVWKWWCARTAAENKEHIKDESTKQESDERKAVSIEKKSIGHETERETMVLKTERTVGVMKKEQPAL